ncbi:unnamed protein product [Closterium sp. NIES-64]|nr:unnamed protein product [Closterium sp. NIES-64]
MFPSSRAAPPLPSPCSPPPSPPASPLPPPCFPPPYALLPPPPFCPASPLPPPCFPPPSAMLPPSLYSTFPRPQPSSLVHTLCLSTPSCSCSFHPTCQEHSGSESESVEEDEEEARMLVTLPSLFPVITLLVPTYTPPSHCLPLSHLPPSSSQLPPTLFPASPHFPESPQPLPCFLSPSPPASLPPCPASSHLLPCFPPGQKLTPGEPGDRWVRATWQVPPLPAHVPLFSLLCIYFSSFLLLLLPSHIPPARRTT